MRLSQIAKPKALIFAGLVLLSGCQGMPRGMIPVPPVLIAKMERLQMDATAPILIRIFKKESTLEVWKLRRDGEYALLKSYEICKWSGELGPKKVEGDKQAPEGFYTVTPAQMNPNSNYYLSFNMGYPNAYDAALGRTGSNLMVHGACSSAGCYSMTDESAGEIFALARDAFTGGQRAFQIQAFPFRMTPENLAEHRDNPNLAFWRMLKTGYDHFEVTRKTPVVDVCDRRYVFNADSGGRPFDARRPCPAFTVPEDVQRLVAAKDRADEKVYAALVAGATAKPDPGAGAVAKASAAPAPRPKVDAPAASAPPVAAAAAPVPVANPHGAAPAAKPKDASTGAAETGKADAEKILAPADGKPAGDGSASPGTGTADENAIKRSILFDVGFGATKPKSGG